MNIYYSDFDKKKICLQCQLIQHKQHLNVIKNINNNNFLIYIKKEKQRKHLPFLFSDEILGKYKIKFNCNDVRSIFTEIDPIKLINEIKSCAERRVNYVNFILEMYNNDEYKKHYSNMIFGYDLVNNLIVKIVVTDIYDYKKYNIESLYSKNRLMYTEIYLIATENFHLCYDLKDTKMCNCFILAKNDKNMWSIMGYYTTELLINNIDICGEINKNKNNVINILLRTAKHCVYTNEIVV